MASFNFSIDSHSLTLIETDGIANEKQVVDKIRLGVGQRHSVLVKANAKPGN
jgi:FtsP/CotA-like multicopper oxidase with cupredoxin domain